MLRSLPAARHSALRRPTPTWTIRTADATWSTVPIASRSRTRSDIASGPVVDLGPADDLDVIVIGGPRRRRARCTIRLWRFDDRGHPERLDLARLASPWPARPGLGRRACARPGAGRRPVGLAAGPVSPRPARANRLAGSAWSCSSVARGRRRPTAPWRLAPGVTPSQRGSTPSARTALLRRLPAAANLWTVGDDPHRLGTDHPQPGTAGSPRSGSPRPGAGLLAGAASVRPSALGVNLPAGQQVTSIELAQVDPLPGPVALSARSGSTGNRAWPPLETPADGLADGIYRMSVARCVGGADRQHWYLEVGPDGRQAGGGQRRSSTSAQR